MVQVWKLLGLHVLSVILTCQHLTVGLAFLTSVLKRESMTLNSHGQIVPNDRLQYGANINPINCDKVPSTQPSRIQKSRNFVLKSIVYGAITSGIFKSSERASAAEEQKLLQTSSDFTDLLSRVTETVYLDVRIANYTEESIGTNKGGLGSGRLIIGLFGKDAPSATKYFLETCSSNGSDFPSYLGSQFTKINDDNLLELDRIRGLNAVSIGGSDGIEYKGKLLTGYNLLEESNTFVPSHFRRGLLTRNRLSNSPQFGITMSSSPPLDQYYEVFGVVIEGEEILDAIENVPRYKYETQTGYASKTKGIEGDIADSWFASQKQFYVNIGQLAGDKRAVDQRNKILKRITIKGCGIYVA